MRTSVAVGGRAPDVLSALTADGLHTRAMRTHTAVDRPCAGWSRSSSCSPSSPRSSRHQRQRRAAAAAIAAQDLLVNVAEAKVDGLSGTVVQNADLGLPAIPGGSGAPAGKLTSLLAGSHTHARLVRRHDQARLAINDAVRRDRRDPNGTDVWTYDSRANTATHTTLPGGRDAGRPQAPAGRPADPAGGRAGGARQGSTRPPTSRIDPAVTVAGQDAYELVLTPKDGASLVKQVRIAVDAENHVPLRVQVFGSGDKAALDVAYTDIAFGVPDARMFAFNPPPGTKVTEKAVPERTGADQGARRRSSRPARPRPRRTPPSSAPAGPRSS